MICIPFLASILLLCHVWMYLLILFFVNNQCMACPRRKLSKNEKVLDGCCLVSCDTYVFRLSSRLHHIPVIRGCCDPTSKLRRTFALSYVFVLSQNFVQTRTTSYELVFTRPIVSWILVIAIWISPRRGYVHHSRIRRYLAVP